MRNIIFLKDKYLLGLLFGFLLAHVGFSQVETATWKAQVALGVNHPGADGYPNGFYAKDINFPTVNLGLQYMFKPKLGAKLDFGFNRFASLDGSPEFKTNYTRINIQAVYDASSWLHSISPQLGLFPHAGPGFSMIKPLGTYRDNTNSFVNVMGGVEIHYGISRTLSVFLDGSYIYGLAGDFDPISEGYGSFNGNLTTFTVGVSISLSGCYYCE